MLLLERILHASQIRKHLGVIGKLLFLVAYLFNTAFRLLNTADGCEPTRLEKLEAQSFFIPLSIGIMVIAFQKIDTVFEFVFFEFSIYTAIKEIIGTGAEIDLWEIVFWVFALIITWYKFKK